MEQKVINELANAFNKNAKGYYFGNITSKDRFSQMVDMLGCVLDQLQRTETGLISPLMRIVAHYAATSTDPDKKAVIGKMTQQNGVCPLLERIQAGSDIIGVWADFLETLTKAIEDAEEGNGRG